jgi:hypothetical protein
MKYVAEVCVNLEDESTSLVIEAMDLSEAYQMATEQAESMGMGVIGVKPIRLN